MRVLVVAIPEKGHLNPLLPTVRRLVERGHDVAIAAFGDVAPAFAGLPVACEALSADAPALERITRGREFAERLRDAAWLSRWVEALLVDSAPAQVPVLEAALARTRPDVVVADPMSYAAAVACARAGVPWAGVSTSLNPVTPPSWRTALTDTLARIDGPRRAIFADHGVDVPRFFVSDAESPWLNVAFTVDAYAPRAAADNARVFSVGAPFSGDDVDSRDAGVDFPFERLTPGAPRVYCSFGSQAFFQPRLFAAIFEAAARRGLQVVASAGDLVDDDAFRQAAPPDAIVVRSAPQLRVLPHVDAVVTHGGANSVVESLARGVPLVLLPLCNDQPLQARFLERAGAGVAVDPAAADAGSVGAALDAVRAPAVVERARAIGRSLGEGGGPDRVADLVEELAQRRAPMGAT